MSCRKMDLLKTYCPEIEIYSIDEAFLDFSTYTTNINLRSYGEQMSRNLRKATSIPISVGFAPIKALDKAANRIAKKHPIATNGLIVWIPVK